MYTCNSLLSSIWNGDHDKTLCSLYALDGSKESLEAGRQRVIRVVNAFNDAFHPGNAPVALFSGPGRTEIGGNHTDHQHGHVLCASVDMDMLACAALNGQNIIRILSEGYPTLEVELDSLSPRESERNGSHALVRGVAAKITEMGFKLSGFDAYVTSTVLSGSGLSSSAAYEVLIGNMFNHFCCDGRIDPITIAKIGQHAENIYFGKPCGLMDQCGSSVGGVVAIDFKDPANPLVEQINFDFSSTGHVLCIVDTGSYHADLTEDYASIPREMGSVAAYFGKEFLRDVPEAEFRAHLPALRQSCGDRALLRSFHYYDDDRRAVAEAEALKVGDFARFLTLVNASGESSALHLQNTWAISNPRNQAIPFALALGKDLLAGSGAIRVHGGGFAGTIQAFVPLEKLETFRSGMEAALGEGMCHVLHIRPIGGCVLIS